MTSRFELACDCLDALVPWYEACIKGDTDTVDKGAPVYQGIFLSQGIDGVVKMAVEMSGIAVGLAGVVAELTGTSVSDVLLEVRRRGVAMGKR